MNALFRLIRPKQWIKNFFVFLPLFFGGNLLDGRSLLASVITFVAFCFSMTIGVLWEFFEFSMEYFFHIDMQRDFIYNTIATTHTVINPSGANSAVVVDNVKSVISGTVNGVPQTFQYDGYLDIGIKDTMKDLMVNCLGAVVFSLLGVFYIKGRGHFAEKFMPTLKTQEEIEADASRSREQRKKKTVNSKKDRNNSKAARSLRPERR